MLYFYYYFFIYYITIASATIGNPEEHNKLLLPTISNPESKFVYY